MKSTLILASAASLAAAINLSGQPACATPCLTSAVTKAGCGIDDSACQCGPTQQVIAGLVAGCLIAACDSAELMQAQSAAAVVCSEFSATAGQTKATSAPTSAATSAVQTSAQETGPSSTAITSQTSGAAPATSTAASSSAAPTASSAHSNGTIASPSPSVVLSSGANSLVLSGSLLALGMAAIAGL